MQNRYPPIERWSRGESLWSRTRTSWASTRRADRYARDSLDRPRGACGWRRVDGSTCIRLSESRRGVRVRRHERASVASRGIEPSVSRVKAGRPHRWTSWQCCGPGGTRTLTWTGKSRLLCHSRSGAPVAPRLRPAVQGAHRAASTLSIKRSTSRFVLFVCSFCFSETIAIECAPLPSCGELALAHRRLSPAHPVLSRCPPPTTPVAPKGWKVPLGAAHRGHGPQRPSARKPVRRRSAQMQKADSARVAESASLRPSEPDGRFSPVWFCSCHFDRRSAGLSPEGSTPEGPIPESSNPGG